MKEDILKAYQFLRKNEQSIPDHVLDFMLNTSLEAVEKPKMTDLKKELLRFKDIVDGMIDDGEKLRDKLNTDKDKISADPIYINDLVYKSHHGINAIIELAEELEKDND